MKAMKEVYSLPAYHILGYGWRLSSAEEQVKLGVKQSLREHFQRRQLSNQPAKREVTLLDVSRPTSIGQLAVTAGQKIYEMRLRKDETAPVMIVAGKPPLHDHQLTSAEIYANQFHLKYPDAEVIQAQGFANTTSTEMDGAIAVTEELGLREFGVVADSTHAPRVRLIALRKRIARRLQGKDDIKIKVLNAKKVLTDPQVHRYSQHISPDEKAHRYSRYYNRLAKTKGHIKLLGNEIVMTLVELVIGHKITDWLAARGLRLKVMSS
jgi:hypothetical protein